MYFLSGILITFLVSVPCLGALPALLEKVQAEYKKTSGLEAQFDQITEIKSTKQKKIAAGRIWIKQPNKLRWETLNPDPNILVSDGKTFWFYTPPFEKGDRGQVIIKRTAQVQTQFLNALLSGSFDFGKTKTEVETIKENEFLLKPKAGTAGDVLSAKLIIGLTSKKIEEVIIEHTSGNKTQIKLKEIHLTSGLEDKLFHFVPDRKTDKLVE
jgi:outer membrane lipoprotein carrier protein